MFETVPFKKSSSLFSPYITPKASGVTWSGEHKIRLFLNGS